MKSAVRRIALPALALVLAGVTMTACSSGTPAPAAGQVGTADGVVKIEGPLVGTDATLLEQSWAGWEKANDIKIEYTGSADFQENIGGEAQQGNAPDLAIFEQPGLINDLAKLGYIQTLPPTVKSTVDATFPAQWVNYTTVGSSDYAAPLLAKLNGWVFYSPDAFRKLNITIPNTWDELLTLTGRLRINTGQPPWCEGFSSDASTGAAGESWVDDIVLREDGPDVYDRWISHDIKFSDPIIQAALNQAGNILQNAPYVNAGFGGIASINTTTTQQVAQSLESGKCIMTLESSSFLDDLQTTSNGVDTVGPNSKIWAFMLPPSQAGPTPFTETGDFVAAFSNDADTVKVQNYLASTAWAKSRMALGGAISPANAITPSDTPNLLLNASVSLMQNPQATIRLSASDLMPSVVGEGTYLSGMVDWINGTPATKVLRTIDGSWPSS
jgi:alpha-glucoside transport system substrate-binding protein